MNLLDFDPRLKARVFLNYKKNLYELMFSDCYTLLFQILSVDFYLTFSYDSAGLADLKN